MTDPQRDLKIIRTETMLEELHSALLGGPGRQGKLEKFEQDIESLKLSQARERGALAVIYGLLSLLGGSEIVHIFRRG